MTYDASDLTWDEINFTDANFNLNYIIATTESGTYTRMVGVPFCPDMLRYEDIGAADNMRGRVVRGFFWMMRWWK